MTDKIALSVIMLSIEGMAHVARFSPADSVGRTELVRLKGLGGDLAHDYEIPRA